MFAFVLVYLSLAYLLDMHVASSLQYIKTFNLTRDVNIKYVDCIFYNDLIVNVVLTCNNIVFNDTTPVAAAIDSTKSKITLTSLHVSYVSK